MSNKKLISDLNINWKVFTDEHILIIKRLLDNGDHKKITAAITINHPEQEYEIQRILSVLEKGTVQPKSKVRAEMAKMRLKGEEPIESPEDEAKWQKKLDKESKEDKEVEETKGEAILASMERSHIERLKKAELVKALEDLGVDVHPNLRKADLQDLLAKMQKLDEDLDETPDAPKEAEEAPEEVEKTPEEVKEESKEEGEKKSNKGKSKK